MCAKVFGMNKQLLTPTEVAKELGVSRATFHAILKRGEIPYRQYGPRTIRIDISDVKQYIDQHTKHSGNGNIKEEIIEW